jgi:hypothetical protein
VNFNELEGEPINYSFTTNETSMDSWLSMSENSTHIIFSGTPTNSQRGNYTVNLILKDNHTETGETSTTFKI